MFSNNEISLILTKDIESLNQIKRIDVIYYHICRLLENRKLAIIYISSLKILVDRLTKFLSIMHFKKY